MRPAAIGRCTRLDVSAAGSRGRLLRRARPERPRDRVRSRVTHGEEPPSTPRPVIPPLALAPRLVAAQVEIATPSLGRRVRLGAPRLLAAPAKLVHVARSALRTAEQEGHRWGQSPERRPG